MTQTYPSINYTPCQIRQVDFLPSLVPCGRCGQDAGRVDVATRTAIDIDLDHPAMLAVRVSVHYCPLCRHYFRAQPPFLRPDAIYTRRVGRKAVESVYADGLAFRTVGQRLARDFWVQPREAIIRRWWQAYHTDIALDDAYQTWIVAEGTTPRNRGHAATSVVGGLARRRAALAARPPEVVRLAWRGRALHQEDAVVKSGLEMVLGRF